MALTYGELNAACREHIIPGITQSAYEDSPFFKVLESDGKIKHEGGKKIWHNVRYKQRSQRGATDPDSKIEFHDEETRTVLELDWKTYVEDAMIPWSTKQQNAGKEQVIDLAADKLTELKENLQDALFTALFATTQGTDDISSLTTIVDSTTTYGGIAYTDAPLWVATEDSSTTKVSKQQLMYNRNLATFGKHGPNLHVTTRDLFSAYHGILDPNMVYEDKKMANLGFDSLSFFKKPVVADAFCPTYYWFGLDMDAFNVICQDDFEISDWEDASAQGYIKHSIAYGTWVGNIVCKRRRTNFKMTALVWNS